MNQISYFKYKREGERERERERDLRIFLVPTVVAGLLTKLLRGKINKNIFTFKDCLASLY